MYLQIKCLSIIKHIQILLCYARNHINFETKEVKYSSVSFQTSGNKYWKPMYLFLLVQSLFVHKKCRGSGAKKRTEVKKWFRPISQSSLAISQTISCVVASECNHWRDYFKWTLFVSLRFFGRFALTLKSKTQENT